MKYQDILLIQITTLNRDKGKKILSMLSQTKYYVEEPKRIKK